MEIWLPVVGFEGMYEVSDFGRVRSLARRIAGPIGYVTGKIMRQTLAGQGYLTVHFRDNMKETRKIVHRLVAEAFLPNPLGLPQVNHKDLDKLNNLPANLEWATCQENLSHAHGKGVPGIWPSGDAWFDKHTWATRH